MKRKILIGIGLTAVVALLVWANLRTVGKPAGGDAASAAPKGAPAVKVTPLARRDLTQTVFAPGAVEAASAREVRAPFSSPAIRLLIGPGDEVTEGQIIAELEADEYRLQVANQTAAVARAESSLAQLYRQRESAPLQTEQKVEAARAQVLQAEQTLASAGSTVNQRLEQSRASLMNIQNRTARSAEQVEAARAKYLAAESEYRASPLSQPARQAYEGARSAYEESLRRAADDGRQASAELAQAQEAVQAAEREAATGGADPAGVQQARIQLENARRSLELARIEAEAGGVQAEQIRSAELDLAAARQSLRLMQQRLEQAQLKAPASGRVLAVTVKSGAAVQQGQALLEIGTLQSLTLKARVDEMDVDKVKPGQSVRIRANAFLGEEFTGEVLRVAVQAVQAGNTGTYFEVQGAVLNPESRLRAGMNIQAEIATDARTATFVVGLQSVREEKDGAFVPIVVDHKVVLKPIKLGLRTQTEIEIIDGLSEGDQVIVSPFTLIRSVKEGDPVRAEPAEPQNRGDAR